MRKLHFQTLRAALLLCCQALLVAEGSSAAESTSSFCAKETVKNYLKPIERLPRVRTVPSSGQLGIGPASLRIFPPREILATSGHAYFEAHGSLDRRSTGPLHWQVESSLFRIHPRSQDVTLIAHKRKLVRSVQGFAHASFGFSKQVKPGVYRLDLEIKNDSGVKLKKYQQYFRALPARTDLRLGVNATSFHPGDTGLLRIENYGTVFADYGFGYRLLNENGEEVPTGVIFSNILLRLPAGTAGYCYPLVLPDELLPGEYEVLSEALNNMRHEVPLSMKISVIP